MRRHVQRAVTLLELVLVIALLGILVVFAWPDFNAATRSEHLDESGRRMATLVAMCRAEAMNEARRYRIEIRPDGSLKAKRQLDPLDAPDKYIRIREGWARTTPLLDDVWVESVQMLPEGPAPILIIDDRLQTPETEYDLTPIDKLEIPLAFDFEPNGACGSLRLVLRDERGRGLLLMLDGRLGRVRVEPWEPVPVGDVTRPEPWQEEPEPEPVVEKRL